MDQLHTLGNYVRARYVDELGLVHGNYSDLDTYVRSTDYDRYELYSEPLQQDVFQL
jgi:hypothetical protein